MKGPRVVDLQQQSRAASRVVERDTRPPSFRELCQLAGFEALIVANVAADIAAGRPIDGAQRDRVIDAARRLAVLGDGFARR